MRASACRARWGPSWELSRGPPAPPPCLLIRDMDDEPLGAHVDIAQAEAEAEAGGLDEDVQTGAAALWGTTTKRDCKVKFSFLKSP